MNRSKKYSINWRDAFHGVIMAFGGAFLDALYLLITTEKRLDLTLCKEAAVVGAIACVAYIGKKYFQNSDSKFTPEQKKTLL